MRTWLRVAVPFLALAAALVAAPARADGGDLTITNFVAGWDTGQATGTGAGAQGTWIPYTISVQNSGAHDFTGSLRLDPRHPYSGGQSYVSVSTTSTTYEESITVPRGATRTYTIWGQFTEFGMAPGWGYEAMVNDPSGNTVTKSATAASPSAVTLVGVLSDNAAVPKMVADAGRLVAGARVHAFDAGSLPRDPLQLSAFAAIVVDQFDLSVLSQAQVQALEDYVAYGGSLIATGGSTWRHTLAQLPQPLQVFRPDSTTAVALNAVTDLLGKTTPAVVPAANGTPAPGALVVLSDADGKPLMLSSSYGAGNVTALTFDPGDDADQAYPDVASAAWAQAVERSVVQTTGNGGGFIIGTGKAMTTPVSVTYRYAIDGEVTGLINDTPANALPPVGLLGGLLMLYILVAGPLNYAFVRSLRRRELMWVTVPLVAVLFTGMAYGAGFASHGGQFYLNEVQLLRVAPDGSADATVYDAVFAPRRGDLDLQLPSGAYASTTIDQQLAASNGGGVSSSDRVVTGRGAHVVLSDVAVWSERAVKTESMARSSLQLESHLSVSKQTVKGTLTNHGRSAVRDLALALPSGKWASLTALVGPGETVLVSAPVQGRPFIAGGSGCYQTGTGVACPRTGPVVCQNGVPCGTVQGDGPPAAPLTDSRHQRTTVLAASALLPSDGQALVGTIDPLPSPRVNGGYASRTAVAAFAMGVDLESSDLLPANPVPKVIAYSNSTLSQVTVADFDLPAGYKGGIKVTGSGSLPGRVEVYDWGQSGWVQIDPGHGSQLTAGEESHGIVRLRYTGNGFYSLQLAATAQ